jgi:hypothetical protein
MPLQSPRVVGVCLHERCAAAGEVWYYSGLSPQLLSGINVCFSGDAGEILYDNVCCTPQTLLLLLLLEGWG